MVIWYLVESPDLAYFHESSCTTPVNLRHLIGDNYVHARVIQFIAKVVSSETSQITEETIAATSADGPTHPSASSSRDGW